MKIQDQNLDSYFLSISVLLDVQANLPETSLFLSAQMALVSIFFQHVYSTWNRYITLQIGGKIILQKTGQKSCIKRVNNFQAQNQVIMKNFFHYCKTFTSSKKLAIML